MNEKSTKDYILPASIIGHADLSRLLREVEVLGESIEADKVRGHGQTAYSDLSQNIQDFIEQNNLDLAAASQISVLQKNIKTIIEHAPAVHMTFASEVDQKNLEKIVSWLRENVHPYALVSVGLQPSLVGGVYLRTPNHVHDFTIKSLLHDKQNVVVEELEALKA